LTAEEASVQRPLYTGTPAAAAAAAAGGGGGGDDDGSDDVDVIAPGDFCCQSVSLTVTSRHYNEIRAE